MAKRITFTSWTGMMIMMFAGIFGAACDRQSPAMSADAGAGGAGAGGPQPGDALPAATQPADAAHDRGEAVFAGGCFWCVEAVFERIEGVKEVVSGYAGGKEETADYELVSGGGTNHAEVVRITYDPEKVSYTDLLRIFFATHDPTQKNRQGPDHGPQYRSAVFFADEQQKQLAAAYIAQLTKAKVYDKPIVTTLEPLTGFYPAEKYHQDFVKRYPRNGYVQRYAAPKLEKLEKQYEDQLKQE